MSAWITYEVDIDLIIEPMIVNSKQGLAVYQNENERDDDEEILIFEDFDAAMLFSDQLARKLRSLNG